MGLWSALGKIGSVVAAPFTGGASLSLMPLIDGIGSIASSAGAAAKGSQDARLTGDLANAQIYRALVDGALGKTNAEIAQKKYELDAGGTRVGQITKADAMRNVQDFKMGGPGEGEGAARMAGWTNTGGLRPSILTDDSKQAANLLIARNLAALQSGEGLSPIELPKAPTLSQPGTMEKVLGGVGTVGGIIGQLGKIAMKKPPVNYAYNPETYNEDVGF